MKDLKELLAKECNHRFSMDTLSWRSSSIHSQKCVYGGEKS